MRKIEYKDCPYIGACCHRDRLGRCTILNSVKFKDKKCHFRKATEGGVNLYDAETKARRLTGEQMLKAIEKLQVKVKTDYSIYGPIDYTDKVVPELVKHIVGGAMKIRQEENDVKA